MKQGSSFAKRQGTLVALACAAVFAAPQAMAEVGTPDFSSGKGLTMGISFTLGLASKVANGATMGEGSNTVRRTEVFSSSSGITFTGSEKLNGAFLQGWGFDATFDFAPDEYGGDVSFENSDTVMGLQTTAGAFFLGIMSDPYKQIGSSNAATGSTWGNGLSQSAIVGNPGFESGTAKGSSTGNLATRMSFYRLNSNSVNWYSPNWNGFKLYAQWVPGDDDIPEGTTDVNPRLLSGGFTYDNGPFNVGYVYSSHKDFFWGDSMGENRFGDGAADTGAGTHASDNAQLLTLGYRIGNFRLGGFYQRLQWSQSGGSAFLTDLSVDSWYLGFRWRSGPHEVGAFYATADSYDCNSAAAVAVCRTGVGDSGMQTYGVGYRYMVSKQLRFFASASVMDNDQFGMYSGSSTAPRVDRDTGVTNPAGLKFTNFSVGMSGSY